MKQQMRIKMLTNNDRCRQKAMRIAVVAKGVTSVALEGDELVVGGDEIDAASLVIALRKKACYAILASLEEVNPEVIEDPVTAQSCITAQYPSVSYEQPQHPQHEKYILVHDSYGPTSECTVM